MILEEAGKDATKAFEEVGHSSDARAILEKYKIGEIVDVSALASRRYIRSSQLSYVF